MRKLSLRARTWISEVCYALLVLVTACFFALSCVALLSQAARTSPGRSWADNWDAVIIGATYFLVVSFVCDIYITSHNDAVCYSKCILSIALCVKRRIAVRRRLQRISKTHQSITQSEVPQPRNTDHSGWGRPGTKLSGIRFRRALLDTIADIGEETHFFADYTISVWSDARARVVIPSHPNLKPHTRMLHHFRFLLPLLPMDEESLSELHYYDSAIQLARTADREPTEEEYQRGMGAANSILQILNECRLEMLEESRMRIDKK
ncbi:hypothetical protein AZE42_06693 [Rhizopogon vesiculosus]|uniref:Defect at low temperature protein 1 n=1 Tax=Rhizopogon vesiculosus TaxID=180088 RepID=A0A1J8PWE4_9AGAM|nr:hypothetical protein AZE42_06693 [Rhizopogon vesiculosus]